MHYLEVGVDSNSKCNALYLLSLNGLSVDPGKYKYIFNRKEFIDLAVFLLNFQNGIQKTESSKLATNTWESYLNFLHFCDLNSATHGDLNSSNLMVDFDPKVGLKKRIIDYGTTKE